MPINIDHTKSGTVTLQTSNVAGNSTFIFPNINGESIVFVSGSPISYVSGLQNCLNSFSQNQPFEYGCAFNYTYCYTILQKTNPSNISGGNWGVGGYSIAFGSNACVKNNYQIAQGIYSNGYTGWNQNVQSLHCVRTPSPYNSEYHLGFLADNEFTNLDWRNSLSYLNGRVVGKGGSEYAAFDFCAVVANSGQNMSLVNYTINTGIVQGGNYTFDIYLDSYSGEYDKISFRVSGSSTPLNWLMHLNQLVTTISQDGY